VQLVAQPQRNGPLERCKALGRVGKVRFQDAVELLQRLVVEADVVEILGSGARLAQTKLDRFTREGRVVTDAREAFFLRGRDDLPVADQRRRAVVIEGRKSQRSARFAGERHAPMITYRPA
jgi:hypothetical protein